MYVPRLEALILAAAMASPAGAAESDLATAALVYNCYTCHGPDGRSPGDVPAIADKSAEYIVEKMTEFKSGEEEATIMNRIAAAFDDEQIARIAAYLAAQEAE